MSMTKTEILLLSQVLHTLTGETASSEVKAHLETQEMRIWLDTWIRPQLRDLLQSGQGNLSAGDLRYLHCLYESEERLFS